MKPEYEVRYVEEHQDGVGFVPPCFAIVRGDPSAAPSFIRDAQQIAHDDWLKAKTSSWSHPKYCRNREYVEYSEDIRARITAGEAGYCCFELWEDEARK